MLAEIVWNEGTLAIVFIFSIPIVGILASAWQKMEQNRTECDLKRSMIERGMSVEEIERVIAAKPTKKWWQ